MEKLTREDLLSLEVYAQQRSEFRPRIIEHKKARRVSIGPNVTLQFEDRMTMQYQIQEMLRIERIFESVGINDELDCYNPLIPDGSNWKATMLIEFPDAHERQHALSTLVGIETQTWVRVEDHVRVFAIADEDLARQNDQKTSSVHFLRFELDQAMTQALKRGADISVGIDHDHYCHQLETVGSTTVASLVADLN